MWSRRNLLGQRLATVHLCCIEHIQSFTLHWFTLFRENNMVSSWFTVQYSHASFHCKPEFEYHYAGSPYASFMRGSVGIMLSLLLAFACAASSSQACSMVVLHRISVTMYGSQLDAGRRSSRYPLCFSWTCRGIRMLAFISATPTVKFPMNDVLRPTSRRTLS